MRKTYLLPLAALSLVTASCSIKENRKLCTAPVTIHVSGFGFRKPPIKDVLYI